MTVVRVDPRFKNEVSKFPGGQNIKRCFLCGTCSSACPVREINEKYNPRKIIRMVILGMRKRVLTNDFIWLCSQCYTCEERCPQDVRIKEVMDVLKNIAVKEGYIHSAFAKQAEIIGETGTLYPISDFENRRRVRLGLPQLSSHNLEVQEIYKITGLDRLITKNAHV